MNVLKLKIETFIRSVASLEQAAALADGNVDFQDIVKMRFLYTQEYSWKLIRRIALYEGLDVELPEKPREMYELGFRLGLITDTGAWIAMMKDRNRLAHVYDEEESLAIYYRIKEQYLPRLQGLRTAIQTTYGK